ncbi:hypothetical protein [Rhizomonospora bruguierae]|uniref:hypothetical protein n=1 Tax=Rhizomonospora bruguierae TaxID=1581705 RepID=UPI001BCEFB52|nr:hypothetical protein [Micromonospora sp. NBRC 107566]
MTTTDPQAEAQNVTDTRDAVLKAIKKAADRYDPSTLSAGSVRDLAEAFALVTGTKEPGTRPIVNVRK